MQLDLNHTQLDTCQMTQNDSRTKHANLYITNDYIFFHIMSNKIALKPTNKLITGESKGSPPRSVRVHPLFRAP